MNEKIDKTTNFDKKSLKFNLLYFFEIFFKFYKL